MSKSFLVILSILVLVPSVLSFCWTAGPYHVASVALAIGVGNLSSSAVCVYSYNFNPNISSSCPAPCQALIMATWGDCYERDPNYYPDTDGADSVIRPLTVRQIFYLLAGKYLSDKIPSSSCRDWMNQHTSDWNV